MSVYCFRLRSLRVCSMTLSNVLSSAYHEMRSVHELLMRPQRLMIVGFPHRSRAVVMLYHRARFCWGSMECQVSVSGFIIADQIKYSRGFRKRYVALRYACILHSNVYPWSRGVMKMANQGTDFTRISIYVPKGKQGEKPLERLHKLGQKRDRSLNYMIVQAVLDYVNRQEKKQ